MLKPEFTGQFKKELLLLKLIRTGTHSELF